MFPKTTALQNTCALQTPSPLLNEAFRYAKENIARCMRYYTLGWGMSNAPHHYAIVVGRDTGWMSVGIDYVAGWFGPASLKVFKDRQKPDGKIIEYVDLETGKEDDYGLNIADNTPHYIWAIWHHWHYYHDEAFRSEFLDSVRAAADHMVRAIGPNNLLVSIPAGVMMQGITSWRNIIPDTIIAGEVTEINALSARALKMAADFTGDSTYADAAERIITAINQQLWKDDYYLLYRRDGVENPQVTVDALFPVMSGIAEKSQVRKILDRLEQPDFWTERGLRTIPNTDPMYDPAAAFGLIGGSWPNPTLWYAVAVAPFDANRALKALEMVAKPVVEPQDAAMNINQFEFPEYFHSETGVNLGMKLSPWVAPSVIWAVMEGLLGVTWKHGQPNFQAYWPDGWDEISIKNLPTANGAIDVTLRPGEAAQMSAP